MPSKAPEPIPPQDRDIAHVCPCLREKWERLVDALENEECYMATIETRRDPRRQAYYLAKGVSWTKNSRHLPNAKGLSLAIDACPAEYLTMKGWNAAGRLWTVYGEMAEAMGLRWGGRWKQRDLCHVEMPAGCECE